MVAVALEPALTLARIMALPLDDLQRLVATGYYREARRRHLTHAAIARRFRKSVRTIATLAREAEAERSVLARSEGMELRRRVVEALSHGPKTLEQLTELPSAAIPLEEVLESLIEEGIIEATDEGTYQGVTRHFDVIAEEAEARLDSLRHFLGAVTRVMYTRFFNGNAEHGFARVLTFAANPEQLQSTVRAQYTSLRDAVIALDEEASETAPHASIALLCVEEPSDHHWKGRSTG